MKNLNDFFILAVGHVFQALLLIVSTRIGTTLLSPLEMGRFSIIYALLAFFTAIFVSSVGTYVQRKIIEWNLAGQASYYYKKYISYLFAVALGSGIFIIVLKNFFHIQIAASNIWIFVLSFGLLFFVNVNLAFIGGLNIFRKRLWFISCSNLTLLCSLGLSALLVLIFSRTAEFWILGQILGSISVMFIGASLFYRVISKPKRQRDDVEEKKQSTVSDVLYFSWPLSLASLILWGHTYAYRFAVDMIHGLAFVGFFSVGFNLGAQLIEKFENLFLNFYDPIFYSHVVNGDDQQKALAWTKYAKAFLPSLVLLAGFICIGRHFLANIFFAPEFQGISDAAVFWGAMTSLLSSIRSTYVKVGIASLKLKGLIVPYFLGVLVMVAFLFLFADLDPFVGTGLALMSGAAVMLFYLMYKMHKLLPVRFPYKQTGLAAVYLIPLWVIFFAFQKIFPAPSLLQSLGVLGFAGLYAVAVELILNKEWLMKSDHALIKKFYLMTSGIIG